MKCQVHSSNAFMWSTCSDSGAVAVNLLFSPCKSGFCKTLAVLVCNYHQLLLEFCPDATCCWESWCKCDFLKTLVRGSLARPGDNCCRFTNRSLKRERTTGALGRLRALIAGIEIYMRLLKTRIERKRHFF